MGASMEPKIWIQTLNIDPHDLTKLLDCFLRKRYGIIGYILFYRPFIF
jgi:hypothetical protein